MLSICGVNCHTDCRAYKTECEGCNELSGKVSWAEFYGTERCPIFACAKQKQLSSCGDCGLAPCDLWYATRNPEASDEEFDQDINSRLKNLNRQ